MPRPTVTSLATGILCLATASFGAGPNPHLDFSKILVGCQGCHKGHGTPRSPMLASPQSQLCQSCHGTEGDLAQLVAKGVIAPDSRPPLLASVLAQAYRHPMTQDAFSRYDANAVTCTSCHSPHRAMPSKPAAAIPSGLKQRSPNDPTRFEYEMCEGCHGSAGVTTQSRTDMSRLLNPNNRSFHPIEATAVERSPSVGVALTGKEINCTDCHGNSDAAGPRGPHGSGVQYILRANYPTADGSAETATTYALCYRCHDRDKLLNGSAFPEHGKHITEIKATCATCHNAHGSVNNRALIRFGEETNLAGVSPSAKTGKLAFVSTGSGSGACYLTCHGEDHAPESYGSAKLVVKRGGDPLSALAPLQPPAPPERRPVSPGAPPPRERRNPR